MQPLSLAEGLTVYALAMMLLGATAYLAADMAPNAVSSVYFGNAVAVLAFVIAVGSRNTHLKKGEPGYQLMFICVHFAILLPTLVALAVAWRTTLAWNIPEKQYILPYFAAIIAASLLVLLFVYSKKPAKDRNEKKKGDAPGGARAGAEAESASGSARAKKHATVKRRARPVAKS